MTAREIVKELMREHKYSYATMAKKLKEKLGITTSTTNVYDRLNANEGRNVGKHDIRVDILLSYLETLDCELVVRDKRGSKELVVTSDSIGNERPIKSNQKETRRNE